MNKNRACVSLLAGVGFVSAVCLSLNIPVVGLLLFALFVPGAIAVAWLNFGESGSAAALLCANALIYSAFAFGVILLRSRAWREEKLKRLAAGMSIPVVALSILCCFPVLNPVLPVGMAELALQERELQQALNPRVNLQEARSVLKK